MAFIFPSYRKFPVLPLCVTVLAVLGGGLAGLILSLHLGPQQTASSSQTDALGLTFFIMALGAVVGGYLASIVICAFKGKSRFAFFGFFGFVAPAVGYYPGWGLIVLVVVGAIRLAKPTSKWARRYYEEDKMRAAILRFPPPVKSSESTPQQPSTKEVPQTPATPIAYERKLNGWQRLWILLAIIWLVPVLALTISEAETQATIKGRWARDIVNMEKRYHPAFTWYNDKSDEDIISPHSDQPFDPAAAEMVTESEQQDKSNLKQLYNRELKNLSAKQNSNYKRGFLLYVIPLVVLYGLGIGCGWIYRGFRRVQG